MTTPRPPKSGGNRRPVRVAGRGATRPTPASANPASDANAEPTAPRSKRTKSVKSRPTTEVSTPTTPESGSAAAVVEDARSGQAEIVADVAAPDVAAPEVPGSETADAGATTAVEATTAVDDTTTPVSDSSSPSADGPRGKSRVPIAKVSTIKPQTTRRPVARPASSTTAPAPRRARKGWKVVGVIAIVAAVFAAVAGVAAIKPGVSLASNEAFVDPALTSQVTSQAGARICTIFGLQVDKLDQWEQVARSNVTGAAAGNFDRYSKAVRGALEQTAVTSGGADCRVDVMGVRSIDGDKAVLLTNLIISTTQNGRAAGSEVKRYQVSMQRTDGKWLISDFVDF